MRYQKFNFWKIARWGSVATWFAMILLSFIALVTIPFSSGNIEHSAGRQLSAGCIISLNILLNNYNYETFQKLVLCPGGGLNYLFSKASSLSILWISLIPMSITGNFKVISFGNNLSGVKTNIIVIIMIIGQLCSLLIIYGWVRQVRARGRTG